MANYDGLTRNIWTGTWSPSGNHPIILDTEMRGGLRYVSGQAGDDLTDIPGQRLQEGMLVFKKTTGLYYKYTLLPGESRDVSTGDMPNASGNWAIYASGGGGGTDPRVDQLIIDVDALELEVDFLRQRVDDLENRLEDVEGELNPVIGNKVVRNIFLNYHLVGDGKKAIIDREDYNIDSVIWYQIATSNDVPASVAITYEADKIIIESSESLYGYEMRLSYFDTRNRIDPSDVSGPFVIKLNGNLHIDSAGNRIAIDYSLYDINVVEAVYVTKYNSQTQVEEIIEVAEQHDYVNGVLNLESNVLLYGCKVHLNATLNPSIGNPQQHIGSDYIEYQPIGGTSYTFDYATHGINKIKSYRIEDASGYVVDMLVTITDLEMTVESNVDMAGFIIRVWFE